MAINFQKTPFNQNVTILDDNKHCLYGDPIEGNQPGRSPKLFFSLKGNYPHLRIKLNNGQTGKDGNLDLAMDMPSMMALIVALEDATRAKEAMSTCIEVRRQGFDRQTNRPTEPYVYAYVIVGKDRDGCEFIGIQRGKKDSKGYLALKFQFTAPDFHGIIDMATGQAVSRPRLSNIMARAWIKILSQWLPLIEANIWDYNITQEGKFAIKRAAENGVGDNQSRNNGYGNNGGNNYNRNNGNNGYNNNRAPASDYSESYSVQKEAESSNNPNVDVSNESSMTDDIFDDIQF